MKIVIGKNFLNNVARNNAKSQQMETKSLEQIKQLLYSKENESEELICGVGKFSATYFTDS